MSTQEKSSTSCGKHPYMGLRACVEYTPDYGVIVEVYNPPSGTDVLLLMSDGTHKEARLRTLVIRKDDMATIERRMLEVRNA